MCRLTDVQLQLLTNSTLNVGRDYKGMWRNGWLPLYSIGTQFISSSVVGGDYMSTIGYDTFININWIVPSMSKLEG